MWSFAANSMSDRYADKPDGVDGSCFNRRRNAP